jgi:hypothetical protein
MPLKAATASGSCIVALTSGDTYSESSSPLVLRERADVDAHVPVAFEALAGVPRALDPRLLFDVLPGVLSDAGAEVEKVLSLRGGCFDD